jgi:hypothetical protein
MSNEFGFVQVRGGQHEGGRRVVPARVPTRHSRIFFRHPALKREAQQDFHTFLHNRPIADFGAFR